jgi:hypothetical protein
MGWVSVLTDGWAVPNDGGFDPYVPATLPSGDETHAGSGWFTRWVVLRYRKPGDRVDALTSATGLRNTVGGPGPRNRLG